MASLWSSLLSGRMLIVFVMGFSSGMPLALVGNTFQAWMKDSHIDLAIIGAISLIKMPYSLKFLWAPFLDRYHLPFLGRRRGWLATIQVGLVASLLVLSLTDANENLLLFLGLAGLIAFLSASQDIVIDAYRREILSEAELALGSSWAIAGYRIGFQFFAGALALYLADHIPWPLVYRVMAGAMTVMALVTLFSPEPKVEYFRSLKFLDTIVEPFKEFFIRNRWKSILLLSFILFYKLGDQMAGNLTAPFVLSLYSKTEYGLVGKSFGLMGTLTGGLLGGLIILRIGLNRALLAFGFIQAISILTFSLLAVTTPSTFALASVIGIETFASGMGTAAYAGFMASLTNRQFTGTQYALLTSLMAVPSSILASPSGVIAKALDWPMYFIFCASLSIPGLIMAGILARKRVGT